MPHNPERIALFSAAYTEGLIQARTEHPDEYAWPLSETRTVAEKVISTIANHGFSSVNHDGRGFKNACKALGIKHTRKAIAAYLDGQ